MMEEFYIRLAQENIFDAPDVQIQVDKMSFDQVVDLAKDCYELTELHGTRKFNDSMFNFAVNSSMSGGVYPCSSVSCRLNNVYDLSVFAALYADLILIPNYFGYLHEDHFEYLTQDDREYFLRRFIGDVILMIDLKPLIIEGIIQINPRLKQYCLNCHKNVIAKQSDLTSMLDGVQSKLESELCRNIKFTLESRNAIRVHSPEGYVKACMIAFGNPPSYFQKYHKRIPYTFNSLEVRAFGINEHVLGPIFDDLILQKFLLPESGVSYLTDSSLEGEVIDMINSSNSKINPNSKILESLPHELPFLKDASISGLLELRKKDGGAFICYRDAVRQVFRDAEKSNSSMSHREAVQAIIAPEINKIERLIEVNKDSLVKKIGGGAIISALSISSGLFLGGIVGGLGGSLTGTLTLKDIMDLKLSGSSEVEKNNYYFLWKIKNRARRK